MKILIAGFEGEDNSAKILLDNMKEECNQDTFVRRDSRRNYN